jgi:hypothetical protein
MGDNMSLASGAGMETAASTRTRRRLFAGMKSLSVFHSRASHERTPPGHAHSRSISLPESRPLYLLAFCFLSLALSVDEFSVFSGLLNSPHHVAPLLMEISYFFHFAKVTNFF